MTPVGRSPEPKWWVVGGGWCAGCRAAQRRLGQGEDRGGAHCTDAGVQEAGCCPRVHRGAGEQEEQEEQGCRGVPRSPAPHRHTLEGVPEYTQVGLKVFWGERVQGYRDEDKYNKLCSILSHVEMCLCM